MKSGLN